MRPETTPDMNGNAVRHRVPTLRGPGDMGEAWDVRADGARPLVELSIPARPEALQLARLSAGFVAAKARLDYDEVQDLRLALDELCLALLGCGGPDGREGRLLLSYWWDDVAVEVTCTVVPDGDPGPLSGAAPLDAFDGPIGPRFQPGAISRQILDTLVDDHAVSLAAGHHYGWLRKCRTGTAHR